MIEWFQDLPLYAQCAIGVLAFLILLSVMGSDS